MIEQEIPVYMDQGEVPCRPFRPISVAFVLDGKYPFYTREKSHRRELVNIIK